MSASHILLDKVALAPGWSAVSYALQILHISPAFVVGIKNSCAVITDLNRMPLCRPGHLVKRLFIGGEKVKSSSFLRSGHHRTLCIDMSAAGRSTSLLTLTQTLTPALHAFIDCYNVKLHILTPQCETNVSVCVCVEAGAFYSPVA